jgi:hypothetical protein
MDLGVNVYLALAIAGLFSGIGSATGAAFVEFYIKPHIQKMKDKKIRHIVRNLQDNFGGRN